MNFSGIHFIPINASQGNWDPVNTAGCSNDSYISRSVKSVVEPKKVTFADSKMPEQLQLEKTNLGYISQFGVAQFGVAKYYEDCWLTLTMLEILFLTLMKHLITSINEGIWTFVFFVLLIVNRSWPFIH